MRRATDWWSILSVIGDESVVAYAKFIKGAVAASDERGFDPRRRIY